MQSIVALEVGMHKRPSLLVERGVVGFHATVETQQEVVEVQTETDAVGGGDFLVERVEFEHASWLVLVAVYCPDVAGVDECRHLKHPEKFGAVLHVEVQTDVATLFHKRAYGVVAVETSGTECAHRPASDAVGAAAVEAFLKWQNRGVAVWHSRSGTDVQHEGVATVEGVVVGVVEVEFHIL